MNIFLDSNVFFKDPFLKKGKKEILLKLAEFDDVKLFINKTVYKEIYRGHKNSLEIELKNLNDALTNLNPFLNDKRIKVDTNIEELMRDFELYFDLIQEKEQLEIIEYDSDVLDYIVDIDMFQKPPFIKENKKEIRDAIIWYSYKLYIEKNKLEDCYFISNNHKEFGTSDAKKQKEQPYSIHPDILGKLNITAYKNIYDFLTHKDDEVKILYGQIISDVFLENIEDELEKGLAEEIIINYFEEQIISETENYISKVDISKLHPDYYYLDGYASSSMDGTITKISLEDIEVYGSDITISIDIDVEIGANIYLYNPKYEEDDSDRYDYQVTETLKIEENVIFIINIDTSKVLDTQNFSLKEYIRENEPHNLDTEIIDIENLDHIEMFPKEDFQ